MITLLLMNLIVGTSAFLINRRVLKFSSLPDSLISLFIIYLSQIVLTETLLGLAGKLFINNLILVNLVILVFVWFFTREKKPYSPLKGKNEVFFELLNNKTILFLVTVILVFSSVKILINLVNPPFGWDDLNYHFTFPVEWLKHGNLVNPITICDDPAPSYYPINGSLFYLWLMMPLRNVFIADLGQVPFFVIAFLSVYSISRKLGVSRESSFFAAALFFIIPNFFKQLSVSYVDVMVAGLFLVALNFLFLIQRDLSLKNTLIYGMSLGLLLGTKTVALPYSTLLLLPFILLVAKIPKKYYFFIIAALIMISLGGFSYIRNFIETGNPLYPLDLRIFGMSIFKGVVDSATYRAHFKPEDYSLSKLLFHEGLGLQSLVFILPSVFLALPLVWLRKRKELDLNLAYFLILPLSVYLAYRYIIPLANTRYLYPLLGMGMIISFYLAGILNIPRRLMNTSVIICALASMAELAKRSELITSFILTFILFLLLAFFMRFMRRIFTVKSSFIVLFCVILSLTILEKYYTKNEYPRYLKMVKYSGFWPDATKAWDWLNINTKGDNIAYVGRPVPFPLYGTNFKNNVYYVSVNKTDPAKLHYFPEGKYIWGYDFLSLHRSLEEKGNYRSDADYNTWLNNLSGHNTDYLFVYSLHQTKEIEFPIEDKWAAGNPAKFNLVFRNETIHIYRIMR